MAEPVAITDAFESLREQSEGDSYEARGRSVIETLGVPADQLEKAIRAEVETVVVNAGLIGPVPAIRGAMGAAFLAGVRWEQGRNA